MCFGGGGGALPAPVSAAATPPPVPAQVPQAAAVRATTAGSNQRAYGSTLLTGGMGDPISSQTLGAKTLLGQ